MKIYLAKHISKHIPLPDRHRTYLRIMHGGHLTYFASVFWEAHGLYAYSAGLLFVTSIVGLAMNEEII